MPGSPALVLSVAALPTHRRLTGAALAMQRVPRTGTRAVPVPLALACMLLLAVPPLLSLRPAARAATFAFDNTPADAKGLVVGMVLEADTPTLTDHVDPVFPVPGAGVVAGTVLLAELALVVAGCLRAARPQAADDAY